MSLQKQKMKTQPYMGRKLHLSNLLCPSGFLTTILEPRLLPVACVRHVHIYHRSSHTFSCL